MLKRALKLGAVGIVVGATAGGTYVSLRNNDLKHLGVCRVARSVIAVGSIVSDYERSFKGLEESDERYADVRHHFHQRSAERLLKLCCANGGTYIKVGQHIAALENLLPEEYINTLKVLHANAPQSTLASVKRVIKEELGKNVEDIFEVFDENPIGCASLAQVHKAKLRSSDGSSDAGRHVAVKVQHNDVYRNSFTDMAVMEVLGRLVDKLFPEFSLLWLVEETKLNLPKELDFSLEAENCREVQRRLGHLSWLRIPFVWSEFTTKRVLVMDFHEGGFVNDKSYLDKHGISPYKVVGRLGKLYSEMIFEQGFVHCDPHPGNILVDPRGNIILLDHGLYSKLSDEFRDQYARMWLAIINRNVDEIERVTFEMKVPNNLSKILASIVTGRRWRAIADGTIGRSGDSSEAQEIKTFAAKHVDLINAVLRSVPREMLLLFKTNDLLRGIEASLGTRHVAKSFVVMSQCCIRGVYSRKLREEGLSAGRRLTLYAQQWLWLVRLSVYHWFRWFSLVLAQSLHVS
ncbi:putative aarF domain-containing protein kinase 1-like [Tropilaelaps mercedesae]|uniref:Putative aarF domain-containing protein kinase 1-like n=1 Tax=Tropilaelaps mercedesae TaxID=418985 RepID=A0A1V9XF11_9ACAR|nr:putative aarF domain-containing protein kinase 1-like [Tropilaelaps mercedesae]